MVLDIMDLPALAPPEGVVSNFDNPDNLSQPELAVVQLIVATLAVIVRIFTKHFIVRKMLVEDYWLLVAWLFFIGFQVIAFKLEGLPMGVHQWDLKIGKAIENAKFFHFTVGVYAIAIIPLKIAIILQIRRIFTPLGHSSRSQRTLRWIMDLFLVLNVIFYLTLVLFQFLVCQPLEAAWNPFVPGKCLADRFIMHIISAAINTASDLILIMLPQPVIWSLNMNWRRQLGLSAVFLVGAGACAASAIRLYHSVLLYSAIDQTYRGALMGKWAEPELTFGFLVVCLPVFPTFFKYISERPAVQRLFGCVSVRKPIITETHQTENSNHVATIGSGSTDQSGRKKIRDMDIEFAELTRPDSREDLSSRDGSLREGWGGRDKGMHDECRSPKKEIIPV